ncbi:Uncharacterised protein [Campylobacter devanensis]|uniref:Uncharacterized protein n=1 Tax=Campylobacter devanensis TaxID=3161138 RepID=A0A1X9SUF7_9BACT|nr:hypothetical protein [Campylobacter lanienae]ARQ99840.1 hypothetical protein CIGN_1605 [Campylobacter lanienae]SUX03092.1 Uncharacterised protein [Campylobacter lanienae]
MLQTILTELQGGDRAKITEVLNAGVKKICEDFEIICLAGDELGESFADDEPREQKELDFEKMSDEEIDAELDRQSAEINKDLELIDKGLNAISECDSLLFGIIDIVCSEFSNESINSQFGKLLKEQASRLSHQKAKNELLNTASKIESFAKDRANSVSVLFTNALYIFKADKLASKVGTNVAGLLDDESDGSFKSALKTAAELIKKQKLGSKLLLWAELKRANQALKAQFPSLSIENLEF